jgi:3-hydroxymyristoyl/3-hydroxydecanoyl-(acyl carrier protein) dehydratase
MTEHVIPLPIAADHPAYAGHFPGRPILPGVVLLDAALHALAARSGMPVAAEKSQLKSAKFHSPVLPGEPLTLHYAESPGGGLRFDLRCIDRHGGERSVASGSVVFSPEPQA